MINITDGHNCCGCSACVQICPNQCISFNEDKQGFCYPLVDKDKCIECGLCEKVCPFLNQEKTRTPIQSYAAINPNIDVRIKSSSGGIFTLLAEKVVNEGGVVFGARFNENWEVEHGYTETIEGLAAFRGSKYVQSFIGNTYLQVRDFLIQGRLVLFSGTPCQIAGLLKFLRKKHENLLTVDVVCHGVPSPLVWRNYLTRFNQRDIAYISTKDKCTGWVKYSITFKNQDGKNILTEKASMNKYMLAFSQNLILRQSCFNCPAKAGKSGSDITLADYWGINRFFKEMNDNKGVSFVCAFSLKGIGYLNKIDMIKKEADYEASIPFNPCILNSTFESSNISNFWNKYQIDKDKALNSIKPIKTTFLKRILNLLRK